MIKGLHSVIFWTDDMPRLLSFYRDTLGLSTDFESPEFVMLTAGQGAQFAVGRHSEVSGRSKDPYRVMANITVDNCQAEYERLKAKGVPFLREPSRDGNEGPVLATFQDPDGNTLQMFEFS